MKNKLVTIILGFILIASIGLNIYLYRNLSSLKTQTEASSVQLQTLNNQINNLQDQLSSQTELQNQLLDNQEQLNNSTEQISNLKDFLSDSETQINSLEQQIEEVKKEIEQQQPKQEEVVNTPAPQQQPVQPANPMPAGSGGVRDNSGAAALGAGTVEPGTLGIGTFE